ncbi:MAG: VOC family protein [Clostridia bacterium]|nr:VOC family protein [Clostridia bacterium]
MPEKLCGLAHIGIYVADAEASKNFYLNTLRFDLKAEHELPNGTKLIFCDAGDCRIELICPPVPVKREEGVVSHIAVECKNIEAWVDALKAKDVYFESEKVNAMNGFPGGAKNIFLHGPDGERIELWEYTE